MFSGDNENSMLSKTLSVRFRKLRSSYRKLFLQELFLEISTTKKLIPIDKNSVLHPAALSKKSSTQTFPVNFVVFFARFFVVHVRAVASKKVFSLNG